MPYSSASQHETHNDRSRSYFLFLFRGKGGHHERYAFIIAKNSSAVWGVTHWEGNFFLGASSGHKRLGFTGHMGLFPITRKEIP